MPTKKDDKLNIVASRPTGANSPEVMVELIKRGISPSDKDRRGYISKLRPLLASCQRIIEGDFRPNDPSLAFMAAAFFFPEEIYKSLGAATVKLPELATALAQEIRAFLQREEDKKKESERKRRYRAKKRAERKTLLPQIWADHILGTPKTIERIINEKGIKSIENLETKEIEAINRDAIEQIRERYFFDLSKTSPNLLEGLLFYAGMLREQGAKKATLPDRPGRRVSRVEWRERNLDTGEEGKVMDGLRIEDDLPGFYNATQCETQRERQEIIRCLEEGVFNRMIYTKARIDKGRIIIQKATNFLSVKFTGERYLPGMENLRHINTTESRERIELTIPRDWLGPILEKNLSGRRGPGGGVYSKPAKVLAPLKAAAHGHTEELKRFCDKSGFKRIKGGKYPDDAFRVYFWLLTRWPKWEDTGGHLKGCDIVQQDGKAWMLAFMSYQEFADLSNTNHYSTKQGELVLRKAQIREYLSYCLEIIKHAAQDGQNQVDVRQYRFNKDGAQITFRNMALLEKEQREARTARRLKARRNR